MKYVLLMYAREGVWPEDEHRVALEESIALCHELDARGEYLRAAPLHPPQTACNITRRDRRPIVANGPFAETKEQLGGYFLIEVADREAAIAIAGRVPGTRRGTAEVRPVAKVRLSDPIMGQASAGEEYMILIFQSESGAASEVIDWTSLWRKLETDGVFVTGMQLAPVAAATSVRLADGEVVASDGPYAPSAAPLIAATVVRTKSIEEATELANISIPTLPIEVRQVLKADGLPS